MSVVTYPTKDNKYIQCKVDCSSLKDLVLRFNFTPYLVLSVDNNIILDTDFIFYYSDSFTTYYFNNCAINPNTNIINLNLLKFTKNVVKIIWNKEKLELTIETLFPNQTINWVYISCIYAALKLEYTPFSSNIVASSQSPYSTQNMIIPTGTHKIGRVPVYVVNQFNVKNTTSGQTINYNWVLTYTNHGVPYKNLSLDLNTSPFKNIYPRISDNKYIIVSYDKLVKGTGLLKYIPSSKTLYLYCPDTRYFNFRDYDNISRPHTYSTLGNQVICDTFESAFYVVQSGYMNKPNTFSVNFRAYTSELRNTFISLSYAFDLNCSRFKYFGYLTNEDAIDVSIPTTLYDENKNLLYSNIQYNRLITSIYVNIYKIDTIRYANLDLFRFRVEIRNSYFKDFNIYYASISAGNASYSSRNNIQQLFFIPMPTSYSTFIRNEPIDPGYTSTDLSSVFSESPDLIHSKQLCVCSVKQIMIDLTKIRDPNNTEDPQVLQDKADNIMDYRIYPGKFDLSIKQELYKLYGPFTNVSYSDLT